MSRIVMAEPPERRGRRLPSSASPAGRRRRIVHVVERDPAVIDALAQSLAGGDLEVITYLSGGVLLDAVTILRPGCLLVEFDLPDMSLSELLHRLRDRRIALPTVVMTARLRDPLPRHGRPAEIAGLLQKPFGRAALLAAIADAFRRRQTGQRSGQP
jgi:two-component system response regulator FixJ